VQKGGAVREYRSTEDTRLADLADREERERDFETMPVLVLRFRDMEAHPEENDELTKKLVEDYRRIKEGR
jgi:hypothetical protein